MNPCCYCAACKQALIWIIRKQGAGSLQTSMHPVESLGDGLSEEDDRPNPEMKTGMLTNAIFFVFRNLPNQLVMKSDQSESLGKAVQRRFWREKRPKRFEAVEKSFHAPENF